METESSQAIEDIVDTTTATGYRDSLHHISNELQLLTLKLFREFQVRKNNDVEESSDAKGFYISDQDIENILTSSLRGEHHFQETTELTAINRQIDELEKEIFLRFSESINQSTQLSLQLIGQKFDLSSEEVDILIIALAAEINKDFETVFAYFNDDLSKKSPTVGLTLNLLYRNSTNRHKGWGFFAAESPLRYFQLLHISGNQHEDGLLNCHFRLDERIKHFLIDNQTIDSALTGVTQLFYPGNSPVATSCREEAKSRLVSILSSGPSDENQRAVFWLYGKSEREKKDTLRTVANEMNFPFIVIDLEDIYHEREPQKFFHVLFRESILQSAPIYFTGGELLHPDGPQEKTFVRTFFQMLNKCGIVFISASSLWVPEKEIDGTSWFPIECKGPDFNERKNTWKKHLHGAGIAEKEMEALAARYGFNEQQTKQVVNYVKQTNSSGTFSFSDICCSANLLSTKSLNKFSKRIRPHFSWGDIVLPKDQLDHLQEITAYIKNKHHVFHSWGFIDKLALGRGVNVLFSGASGTGKTMAADIMAAELKLELYKVDLSAMVSKYIGETEKNLNKVFDEMSTGNTILFFDEADAIFGKRSEVKDAHDRYANIEINYLLQKIEEHEGVVILATNLKKNIDDAFSRRIHFSIDFPFPEKEEREAIWKQVFPKKAPLAKKMDYAFLAEKLEFAGGNIKNIALTSAFYAVENGGKINMEHIINAAKREYQKLGKPFVFSDFKEYLNVSKK